MHATEPVVRTAVGLVRGRITAGQPGIATFLGIPFAQPPVGNQGRAARQPDARTVDGVRRRGDPGWPQYAPGRRTTRIFDDPPGVTGYPEQASLHIWDQHRFGSLELNVQAAR
jgi:hypothetical protein